MVTYVQNKLIKFIIIIDISILGFLFVMRGLCVVYVWLGQTSVNENPTKIQRI